jgi:hypothetical protein
VWIHLNTSALIIHFVSACPLCCGENKLGLFIWEPWTSAHMSSQNRFSILRTPSVLYQQRWHLFSVNAKKKSDNLYPQPCECICRFSTWARWWCTLVLTSTWSWREVSRTEIPQTTTLPWSNCRGGQQSVRLSDTYVCQRQAICRQQELAVWSLDGDFLTVSLALF